MFLFGIMIIGEYEHRWNLDQHISYIHSVYTDTSNLYKPMTDNVCRERGGGLRLAV